MESKTPRTDSESRFVYHTTYYMGAALSVKIEVVDADVARRLETELAEARAALNTLAAEVGAALVLPRVDFAAGECVKPRKHAIWIAMREIIKQRDEARAEIERKDKLIEQMYEAIKFSLIADEVRQTRNVCASDINDACKTSRIKRIAALSAAERGE